MRAVGYLQAGPAHVLQDVGLLAPEPGPGDLLVEVRAVSVNPVDIKMRSTRQAVDGVPEVLGWDVAGVVRAIGSAVTLFEPGDEVFYAGSIARPGGNSELHLVDERIVGPKPTTLDFAEAAALPLTAITAWELLFERLGVEREGGVGQTLLVVGAAGGVGSILVQLASQLTRLRVVGTASRPETAAWVTELGAHDVIDHRADLRTGLTRVGVGSVELVASLTHSAEHFTSLVEVIAPQGRLGVIDDLGDCDIALLKPKSVSLHWEFMFTRAVHETPDMVQQHRLLTEVAALVDRGILRTTLGEVYGRIDAAGLIRAHEFVGSGRARGKVVLAGWPP